MSQIFAKEKNVIYGMPSSCIVLLLIKECIVPNNLNDSSIV